MTPYLNFLPLPLQKAIEDYGQIQEFEAGAELIKEGQYVKVIPIVLEGAIKVISRFEEKDLLLYYILNRESCIMSLTAVMENSPSKIYAVTESPVKVILISSRYIQEWIKTYPYFQQLFFRQFHQRYDDLLDTIRQLLFEKVDSRVLNYLQEKAQILGSSKLKISHRQIAKDLGSAREVISRAMKKLEHEGTVTQPSQGWIYLAGP